MKKVPLDPLGSTYGYEPAVDGTYYKLYACLENDQQILPYLSTPASFSCTKQCFKQEDKKMFREILQDLKKKKVLNKQLKGKAQAKTMHWSITKRKKSCWTAFSA